MREWESGDVLLDRPEAAARLGGMLALEGCEWRPPGMLPLSEPGAQESCRRFAAAADRYAGRQVSKDGLRADWTLRFPGAAVLEASASLSTDYDADDVGTPAHVRCTAPEGERSPGFGWALRFAGGEGWGLPGVSTVVLDRSGQGVPRGPAGEALLGLWSLSLPPLLRGDLPLPGHVCEAFRYDGTLLSMSRFAEFGWRRDARRGLRRTREPWLPGVGALPEGWWAVRLWTAGAPMAQPALAVMPPEVLRGLLARQYGQGLSGGLLP